LAVASWLVITLGAAAERRSVQASRIASPESERWIDDATQCVDERHLTPHSDKLRGDYPRFGLHVFEDQR
jgi:hypothetical protein